MNAEVIETVRSSCCSLQSGCAHGLEEGVPRCRVSVEESESESGKFVSEVQCAGEECERVSARASGLGFFLVWPGHVQAENVILMGILNDGRLCPLAMHLD